MIPRDFMAMAKIVALHGYQGSVKAMCLTDTPDHLLSLKNAWVYGPGFEPRRLEISTISHGGGFFL